MSLVIRTATREDAGAIATIRVRTWRVAYAGLIDQSALDGLDIQQETARRAAHWPENHADPLAHEYLAEWHGEPVGWAAVGPTFDPDQRGDGEVYALYALPEFWNRGIGHALLTIAEEHLRGKGFRRAHLWYLEGNARAGAFYERHGWREDGGVKVDDRLLAGTSAEPLRERRRVKTLV